MYKQPYKDLYANISMGLLLTLLAWWSTSAMSSARGYEGATESMFIHLTDYSHMAMVLIVIPVAIVFLTYKIYTQVATCKKLKQEDAIEMTNL